MIYVEAQYFSLCKSLLLFIGLWPYQQSKAVQFQSLFYSWILATAVIFQLTTFFTSKCTMNFIVKVLGTAVAFTIFLMKYVLFRMHMETMKDLLTHLQHICNGLKEKKEIEIIEKYGCNARRYTAALTIILVLAIFSIIIVQFSSSILDFVLPKNKSRPHRLQIEMEYFLDQDKFFRLIMIHLTAAILIGKIALVAIGAMFIAYFQYICGMFTIASYRIEHAIEIYILQDINLKNEHSIFKRLICAIDIHRQAMQLCDLLIHKFEMLFLCLIVLGVACLSFNLLQIFQIASTKYNTQDFMSPVIYTIFSILYMFLANYVGQEITDQNDYIYIVAYNTQWYKVPVHIQKLILFLLQKGVKSFTLSIGGLFDASIECFATLVKASVSYFTVIYSTR
ncbi:hypothetical protein HN011_005444 [Eciton burchellii]|nr:hypothetical protein HN011_005444 [Eciton burchellii]